MEWIDALRGETVGLDTAPLIYFITLLEVLVHPLRNRREDLAREYRDILLRSPSMTALPFDEEIAEEAARLRALHSVRTPDAIQLATAKIAGATWFLTNDGDLPPLPGVSVLVVDRLRTP